MSTLATSLDADRAIPRTIQSSCDFVHVLMKLQRATTLISSTLDLESLIERVVTDIATSIGNVKVALWLHAGDSDEMILQEVRGCCLLCSKGNRLRIGSEGMVGHVAASGKMHYAPDVDEDPYYIRCEPGRGSEVCIPLLAEGRVMGVLSVAHHDAFAFSEDQLMVLEALAGHIAVAVENSRAFGYERSERERLLKESADARAIQQALLGRPVPLIPGFAFEMAWHPAGAVAGDWFDVIDLGNQRYGIALADVSGKGMSAALLMSATRSLLRSVAPLYASPAQTLEHLNRALTEDFPMGKFVTMVYGVLEPASRTFTLASAGHLRPLLMNGTSRFLEVDTGLPLGLGISSYPQHTVTLAQETRLLLYTDGITEATDRSGEEFGPERLLQFFSDPDVCVDGLIAEVQRFSGLSEQSDDATALLIRSR